MATPTQEGREIRAYECACGHSRRTNVALADGELPPRQLASFNARPKIVHDNDCSVTFATKRNDQALDNPDDKGPS
jgi:prepilin-type processing-associated H-X9-DG protein